MSTEQLQAIEREAILRPLRGEVVRRALARYAAKMEWMAHFGSAGKDSPGPGWHAYGRAEQQEDEAIVRYQEALAQYDKPEGGAR